MVEGGAGGGDRDRGHRRADVRAREAQPVLELIEKMRAAVGKPKREFSAPKLDEAIARRVAELADAGAASVACVIKEKKARYDALRARSRSRSPRRSPRSSAPRSALEVEKLVKAEFEERKYHVVREHGARRRASASTAATPRPIRPITCEVGLLPRVHGSALFQRGETQAIVTTTLGTAERRAEDRRARPARRWKRFMLHYNFPPFSHRRDQADARPRPARGRSRRARRARAARACSRRTTSSRTRSASSARSSSRTARARWPASAAARLSLMDCGVPIKAPGRRHRDGPDQGGRASSPILSDILGDEDHLGDMDFKVCGTERGITAIQMDIKIAGLDRAILEQALDQAREGRLHILGKMLETLAAAARRDQPAARRASPPSRSSPTRSASSSAPAARPSRASSTRPAAAIDVEDDGTVGGRQRGSGRRASARSTIIEGLTAEPEVGTHLQGHGQAHRRLRRVRRDPAEHRGAAPRLRDRARARRARRRRAQGGRRGRGQGDQRRARRQDAAHAAASSCRSPKAKRASAPRSAS